MAPKRSTSPAGSGSSGVTAPAACGSGRGAGTRRRSATKSRVWLGTFYTPELAARAYDAAARRLRGPGATTNYPTDAEAAAAAPSASASTVLSEDAAAASSSSLDLSLALPAMATAQSSRQVFVDPTARVVAVAPALLQFLPPKSEEEQSFSSGSSSPVVFDAVPAMGLVLDLNLAPPAATVM